MPLIPCRLHHVLIEEANDAQTIFLRAKDNRGQLAIAIGPLEAQAIMYAVKGQQFERPLTHDFVTTLLNRLDAELESVRITDVRGGIYYCECHVIASGGERYVIDARPSDGVALASRAGDCHILIDEELLTPLEQD